jgi:ribose transport system ATP-binding protein
MSKTYGGVVALRGASVHAYAGEIHGLIGENGAGKSTLVKILSGAIAPDSGEIVFRGTSLLQSDTVDARQVGIATAYQELSLIPDWDVATNLLYASGEAVRRGRVNVRAARRAATAAMRDFGIGGIDPARPVRTLRLAERQMLEIMRALLAQPQILILDEPTSALTPDQVWWFFEQVRSFVEKDRVVLFISHRLEEIRALCHRVTVLRDGSNVGGGVTAEFTGRHLVQLVAGEAAKKALDEERARREAVSARVRVSLREFSSAPELAPIDLDVREGEIVGIAGLEGQGQLELFLALYGARRSSGTAELNEKRLALRSPAAAIEQGVGLVPHDRGLALCLPLSIRDNLTLGSIDSISRFGLIDRDRERALVQRAMSSLRVRARGARTLVETLSGGNQQKVLLGRVLSLDPSLLLLYDATRGVDVGTKAEIFHLVRQQADAGVAILFYSTDVAELIALSDRIVVLHDGRIRAELLGDDISEEKVIEAVIGSARHD